MTIIEKWVETTLKKNSLLCVGLDPAEPGQRASGTIPENVSKMDWCADIIEKVAPYSAAIKINRNYVKDLSRDELKSLNDQIHHLGMLSIDDSKIADIGDTNSAGFYHAVKEGFDLITYAPFPGNIKEAAVSAKKHNIGLIALVLMSNPEYEVMKYAEFSGTQGYKYLANEVEKSDIEGVVIGAPSPKNHIKEEEISAVSNIINNKLVLVPGLGAQGGGVEYLVKTFGRNSIINVGRSIMFADDPREQAAHYQKLINEMI